MHGRQLSNSSNVMRQPLASRKYLDVAKVQMVFLAEKKRNIVSFQREQDVSLI